MEDNTDKQLNKIQFAAIGSKEIKSTIPEPAPKNPDAVCPACGKGMIYKTMPGKGKLWIHEKKGSCKLTFKNKMEIESYQPDEISKSKKEEPKPAPASPQPAATKPTEIQLQKPEREQECEIVDNAEIFTWENEIESKEIQEEKTEQERPVEIIDQKPEIYDQETREVPEPELIEIKEKEEQNMANEILEKRERGTEQFPKDPVSPTTVQTEKKSKIKRITKADAEKLAKRFGEKTTESKKDIKPEVKPYQEKKDNDIPKKYDKTEVLKTPTYEVAYPTLTNLETGEIIELDKPSFYIGREEGDFLIQKTVISAKHVQFITKNGTCYVKDLKSTNGTMINGYQVPPETEVEIKDGQTVCLADEEFAFTYEG